MRKFLLSTVALAGAVLALSGAPANATLTLQSGLVGGSGDVDNVIFNTCGTASSGMTVQGCLNTSNTTLVNFASNEMLNISGGGQAVIGAVDGSFNTINIALANPLLGFDKLQFNLDAVANGTATFQAIDQFGDVFNFGPLALSGTGQNFFTLGSLDGQVAVSFSLVSTVGISNISNLEQVRLGAATRTPVSVPEPASLALFGAGLLGLGLVRRRKNQNPA
jgi:hypothetical protein